MFVPMLLPNEPKLMMVPPSSTTSARSSMAFPPNGIESHFEPMSSQGPTNLFFPIMRWRLSGWCAPDAYARAMARACNHSGLGFVESCRPLADDEQGPVNPSRVILPAQWKHTYRNNFPFCAGARLNQMLLGVSVYQRGGFVRRW